MNDKQKQQLMVALVVFNFSVIGYLVYKSLSVKAWDMSTLLMTLLIGAAIGIVPAVIGYFVGGMGK
jgi:hypothetical protein